MDWTQIREDYTKARAALWDNCPRDEESGLSFMWKAYQAARSAETKDHLTYARILVMMSREERFRVTEYDRLRKYVAPALNEYRQAVADGQRPAQKELDGVQWEYDALSYRESRADAPYEEQVKAIRGYEKLSKFCFYDSHVLSFSHAGRRAKLTLQYYSVIATFSFDDVYEIRIDADPVTAYVNDFCCYPCFEDKSMINFDIGEYQIRSKAVAVESVELDCSG